MFVPKDAPKLKSDSLIKSSFYNNEFNREFTKKIERRKVQDNLKYEGPSQKITNYSKEFSAKPRLN